MKLAPQLLLAAASAIASPAFADIYKCPQPDGHLWLQDHPCPGTKFERAAASAPTAGPVSAFAAARKGFATRVTLPVGHEGAPPTAPADVFRTVTYPSPVGALPAYLTPDPHDGARHPAIVWITGGDFTSIGDVWSPAPRSNDQSAAAFRRAGIVTMFPSLRGGNANPGRREAFYGEADDILAAADFLARQPYVDPTRIYLGGHSTGGTMVLLTGELSARFRAVFAFGPVGSVDRYGNAFVPVDFSKLDPNELKLRAPEAWLPAIGSRVFVLEGEAQGNIAELRGMQARNHNPLVTFVPVPGATHFSILAPATDVIAAKIVRDTGPQTTISLAADEIAAAMR